MDRNSADDTGPLSGALRIKIDPSEDEQFLLQNLSSLGSLDGLEDERGVETYLMP
jgi:hypothetical protein